MTAKKRTKKQKRQAVKKRQDNQVQVERELEQVLTSPERLSGKSLRYSLSEVLKKKQAQSSSVHAKLKPGPQKIPANLVGSYFDSSFLKKDLLKTVLVSGIIIGILLICFFLLR